MKILFLTEFFPTELGGKISGGTEARTYYIALELLKRGHQVTVVTSKLPNSKDGESWNGLKVILVGIERNYTTGGALIPRLIYLFATIKKGSEKNYDIVD